MTKLVDTFARTAQQTPSRLQQLRQWKQQEEMRIENESTKLARTEGQEYARQFWLAEHEILTLQPEWIELKSLQNAPGVPRMGQKKPTPHDEYEQMKSEQDAAFEERMKNQPHTPPPVQPNPQPTPAPAQPTPTPTPPPTATERGTGTKWNPANWFKQQQQPKPSSDPSSPQVDPTTHLIDVPPTNQLRDYYMRQIENNPLRNPKPKHDAPDKDVSILDPYAEVSIGGETLRPRHNEIIKQLIPHRKKYLDHLLRKIDQGSTPVAKDRAYREMIMWLDQQHRRDLQLAEMTKVLRETVPPEYQTLVEENGGTLPPVPSRQAPVVGPVPEIPPEVIKEHKQNVQQRRRDRAAPPQAPAAPAQPSASPAPAAPPAAPAQPGTVQTKRVHKPKVPPTPKQSAVELAEQALQERRSHGIPWYKR